MDLETKSRRLPFSENAVERTYLKYFAAGDLQTCWHGRKVRIAMGTTHPAQLKLVEVSFGKYTKPIIYPAKKSDAYCWRIVCDLDTSFRFLFTKLDGLTTAELERDELFFPALAGFADAEGHVGLQNSERSVRARFLVCNTEKRILEQFQKGLELRGIHTTLSMKKREGWKDFWTLRIHERDVPLLLKQLDFRHGEKVMAKTLVLKCEGKDSTISKSLYRAFRARVLKARNEFIVEAGEAYSHRGERKLQKIVELKTRILRAHDLETGGVPRMQIGRTLGRSERTIYRWLSWYRHREGFGS